MTYRSDGFTAVEAIVTLVVAVMFILLISTLFTSIDRATAATYNRSEATSLAYRYVRRYVYPDAPTDWFTACDATTDVTQNPGAGGTTITSTSLSDAETALPQPVTVTVKALAPFGCSATTKPPLLVRAVVTYGPGEISVNQSSLMERL